MGLRMAAPQHRGSKPDDSFRYALEDRTEFRSAFRVVWYQYFVLLPGGRAV